MVEVGAAATLLVSGGPNNSVIIKLTGRPITLGRRQDNDVVIDETTVSRQHSLILDTPGGFASGAGQHHAYTSPIRSVESPNVLRWMPNFSSTLKKARAISPVVLPGLAASRPAAMPSTTAFSPSRKCCGGLPR